ncbi:metalloregulator ArsR/SmtB family transcription factor [Promicromonospora sukumoe]|uniref:DNA-binding transcriptional ArsR family regulator n=1 Tax=Promicromonospora sukumoe TaxID=88382 RepID=A0A7W3J6Y5_9MICO|nr:metalloregulator ArsR/SmtB family transcription factor [Promicromonospora sukumoe]MBA8807452.1 DNA-binding transcriptional ArsR family regulator [Promicromonospora sukumoe]
MPAVARRPGGEAGDGAGALDTAPAHVFEALGDPVRRRLLELLVPGEQPAGALVAALQARVRITQPAVSQHLKVLREAGLVRVRAEGTRRLYAVDDAGTAAARAWLARFEDTFAQPLDALATELARGRRERRRAAGTSGAGEHDTAAAAGTDQAAGA